MERERRAEEIEKLSRVQAVYAHPLFRECLDKNRAAEETRAFCVHDMNHFLDVARLAYIFSLERGYKLAKEEIYGAALLHDIGKWRQYTEQVPHEQAGAEIAEKILRETGFTEEERGRMLGAILEHRGKMGPKETSPEEMNPKEMNPKGMNPKEKVPKDKKRCLAEVLYDGDKISRACYACSVEKECNWSEEKKNLGITW